jgi:hypothetical protein
MMTQAFGDIFSRRDMAPSHQLLTLEGTPGASGMFQLGGEKYLCWEVLVR